VSAALAIRSGRSEDPQSVESVALTSTPLE
jgi:hypothetical protein